VTEVGDIKKAVGEMVLGRWVEVKDKLVLLAGETVKYREVVEVLERVVRGSGRGGS
jgi:hypothetical protein